jgi:PGF-pre-PGF domain-containing protein
VVDTNEDAVMTLKSISVSVETSQATMTVEDVPAPEIVPGSQNVNPVGAIDITETGIISQASLRFSVSESYLTAIGATADELVIFHETENGWTQLSTEVIETRDDVTIIEADTGSFSLFVVAVEDSQFGTQERQMNTTVVSNSTSETTAMPESTPSEVREGKDKLNSTDRADEQVNLGGKLNASSTDIDDGQSVSRAVELSDDRQTVVISILVIVFMMTILWYRRRE